MSTCSRIASGWRGRALAGLLALASYLPAVAQTPAAPQTLRIVGGLGTVNAFTRHEEPFWSRDLAQLSGGRYAAEIVPFDRAGIRGQEMLSLLQAGAVPFATVLLGLAAAKDPDLLAMDLAGLNPDIATLRRNVAAFRPYVDQTLRERYGVESLAYYAYPAQVVFCNGPIAGLDGLRDKRIRTSTPSQSDWVEALGAKPVMTPFNEIVSGVKAGSIDCAITGTMSGNTIGLHEVTSHLHSMAVSWGVLVFAANGAAWNALPQDLRALLKRELPRLEKAVWDEAERDTAEGVVCNVGSSDCRTGKRGKMVEVKPSADDERRRQQLFAATVLPRWLQRCGAQCATAWNRTLAPLAGVQAALR